MAHLPILYIGNLSKYTCGKLTAFSAHHVVYIPKLVNTINDFYLQKFSKSSSDEVLTHCKRELFQAIWNILLDDEFVDAYTNGMVVECSDQVL
jgi:hypothetical protein